MKRFSLGLLLACAGACLTAPPAPAMPTQVIIIRHAEKPSDGNTLCQRGVCRAVALGQDFVPQFGKPSAIYAMGPGSADSSVRPIETVTPLANALGMPIHSQYTQLQFSQVVADVESNSGMVLIAWEHKAIPGLVQAFCGNSAACGAVPAKWKGKVFDQAWILNLDADGNVLSFQTATENTDPPGLNCTDSLAPVLPAGSSAPTAPPACAVASNSDDSD